MPEEYFQIDNKAVGFSYEVQSTGKYEHVILEITIKTEDNGSDTNLTINRIAYPHEGFDKFKPLVGVSSNVTISNRNGNVAYMECTVSKDGHKLIMNGYAIQDPPQNQNTIFGKCEITYIAVKPPKGQDNGVYGGGNHSA